MKLACVDQMRERLDPAKSVWELVSGGERNHLNLALTLREEANVILRALEEGILNYAG